MFVTYIYLSQNDCLTNGLKNIFFSWNLLINVYIYIHLYTKKKLFKITSNEWMNMEDFSLYIYETMFEHIFFVHLKFKNVTILIVQIVHLTMLSPIVHFFSQTKQFEIHDY
jgi:hypothetical protein